LIHGSDTRARSGAPSSLIGRLGATLGGHVPDGFLTQRLFRRALGVWFGVRIAVVALQSLPRGEMPWPPASFGFFGALVMAAIVAALGLVDVAARNERLLFANLGVPRRTVVLISSAAALAGETLVTMIFGVGR
jgi:hypothetical protein